MRASSWLGVVGVLLVLLAADEAASQSASSSTVSERGCATSIPCRALLRALTGRNVVATPGAGIELAEACVTCEIARKLPALAPVDLTLDLVLLKVTSPPTSIDPWHRRLLERLRIAEATPPRTTRPRSRTVGARP